MGRSEVVVVGGVSADGASAGGSVGGSSSGGATEAKVVQLRRQERELTKQLLEVAAPEGDSEAQQAKTQLLNAQLDTVRMQITALLAQQQREERSRTEAAASLDSASTATRAPEHPVGDGYLHLDVQA